MLTMFFDIPFRSSDCVERMVVDPVRGVVQVAYRKGSIYEYTHVSRRAILNLICQPQMSLGLWVNQNLKHYKSKCARFGDVQALRLLSADALPEIVL